MAQPNLDSADNTDSSGHGKINVLTKVGDCVQSLGGCCAAKKKPGMDNIARCGWWDGYDRCTSVVDVLPSTLNARRCVSMAGAVAAMPVGHIPSRICTRACTMYTDKRPVRMVPCRSCHQRHTRGDNTGDRRHHGAANGFAIDAGGSKCGVVPLPHTSPQ